MRLQRKHILRVARDALLPREDLRRLAHVQPADGIGEAELQPDARRRNPPGETRRTRPAARRRAFRLRRRGEFPRGRFAVEQRHGDMLSTPPTRKSEPRPAAMRSYAVVIASKPEAQLRCTVTAGTSSGTPARRAITRATFAASGGWQTQPKITSSSCAGIDAGAREQRIRGDAAELLRGQRGEIGADAGEGSADAIDDVERLGHQEFGWLP